MRIVRTGKHIRISSLIKKKVKPKGSAVRVLRVTNLFQEALVTQFLDNYLLTVHVFHKKLPQGPGKGRYNRWTVVRRFIGKHSDDYGRRTSSSFKIL